VVGDAFFAFIDQGSLAPWTGKAHQQNEVVVGAAAAAAGRLAIGGYAVTYDGGIGPWFVDAFVAATGLAAVHYVILLPPEPTCVERCDRESATGFANLDATRHMYQDFADAAVDARHVIASSESAESIATRILRLVQDGAALWPTHAH
jgi:hypothetical protein